MGIVELLVPMAAMAMLAVIVGLITRLIATGMMHRTIREAMRSDPERVQLLADRLEARQPWADALLGWIFVALAIGIALLAVTEPDGQERREMLRAAIVPLIIGLTVLLFTNRRNKFETMRTRHEEAMRQSAEQDADTNRAPRNRRPRGGATLPVEPAPKPSPLAGGAEAPLG